MRQAVCIFLFLPIWVSAQDITGVWTGYLKTTGSKLDYELTISEADKKLSGYSLIIYPKDGIENIGIKKATIKQGKKDIHFEDGELVYDNFTTPATRVKMFGTLSLATKDSLMILQGKFSTRSLDFRDTRTYSGEIYLQKTNDPASSKLLVTLEEINFPYSLSFITPTPKKEKDIAQTKNDNLNKESVPEVVVIPESTTEKVIEKQKTAPEVVIPPKSTTEKVIEKQKTAPEVVVAPKPTTEKIIEKEKTAPEVVVAPKSTTEKVIEKQKTAPEVVVAPKSTTEKVIEKQKIVPEVVVTPESSTERVSEKQKIVPELVAIPKSKTERIIEKIREIDFSTDSLLLSFYDNGTIDGDTVTITLNGKTLVEKLRLTGNAFKITIPSAIKPGDSLIIVMHAESLGLIPPNTGLLYIQDGEIRHQLRFEGDLQRSSAITLRKRNK